MTAVVLEGRLCCANEAEAALVRCHLPEHIRLTRAEPGCLVFTVEQSVDPFVWTVRERFADAASFEAHQARVRASEWGRATATIRREYTVTASDESPPTGG